MALSEIEKLERRYAENPQGLTFAPLAEVHRKNGDVARALELLRPGLTVHPDYIPASIVLGRCHLDRGELPDAEAAFNHVLSLDAENVIALKALADIAERMFRFDDAERVLHALLVVDRSNDEARDQLSRVEAAREQAQVGSSIDAEPPASEVAAGAEPVASGAVADAGSAAADQAQVAEPETIEGIQSATPAALDWPTQVDQDDRESPPLDLVGIEPEAMEAVEEPPEGILLEEPVTFEDDMEQVEPMPGMIGRGEDLQDDSEEQLERSGPMVFGDDFRVETAEDIVLESSGGSEFQMANAAEELLNRPAETFELEARAEMSEPEVGELKREPDESVGAVFEAPAEESSPEDSSAEAPNYEADVIETAAETSMATVPVDEAAGAEVPYAEAPVGEAPPVEAPVAEAPVAEKSADAESETTAALPPEFPPAVWTRPTAEPEPRQEPEPVITESMAELLLQQGYRDEALTVFRHLERRNPGDPRLLQRIGELDAAAGEAAPAAAEAPAAGWSVTVTHGRPVGEFLGAILAARLPAVTAGPAVRSESPRGSGGDGEGAPTRPAHDSLSLSSVFGEESTPNPPAVPAAGSGSPVQSGVSFDEFFGAPGAPAGARPPRGAETQNDDLDQFHAWLQNLKR